MGAGAQGAAHHARDLVWPTGTAGWVRLQCCVWVYVRDSNKTKMRNHTTMPPTRGAGAVTPTTVPYTGGTASLLPIGLEPMAFSCQNFDDNSIRLTL